MSQDWVDHEGHFNFVQIGLGTNRTMVHQHFGLEDRRDLISYMDVLGYGPCNRGLSIEPIPWLLALLIRQIEGKTGQPMTQIEETPPRWLYQSEGCELHFLQSACGRYNECLTLHGIKSELYETSSGDPAIDNEIEYLANMSSTNTENMAYGGRDSLLEGGAQAYRVPCLNFMSLVHIFKICSIDLVIIDTEGSDCAILESLLECVHKGVLSYPTVIHFETLGHCDLHRAGAEVDMIRRLASHGYSLVMCGYDSIMVYNACGARSIMFWYCVCAKCGCNPSFFGTELHGWYTHSGGEPLLQSDDKPLRNPWGEYPQWYCPDCEYSMEYTKWWGDSSSSTTNS